MSDQNVKDITDDINFCWGKKRGRGGANKDVQFYESFTYDGVEYFLYDSVYLFKEGETEPYVGKILKIYEDRKREKKVKILWFFRPSEILNYLEGVNVLENELFLACGDGSGLANINPLEAIAGKCIVICISKDGRNRQPSVEELKMADFVFYRTFNVQNLIISDMLDEKIALVDVKLLVNKNEVQQANLPELDSGAASVGVGKSNFVKNTLVVNSSVDDMALAPSKVKNDKGAKMLVDKSKFHPPKNGDTAGPDNIAHLDSIEEKLLSSEATPVVDGDAECNGSLRPSVGKVTGFKEKFAVQPDNAGALASPGSEQQSRLKSPELEQNDSNKLGDVPANVIAAGKERSEQANDANKQIVVPKAQSDRLSKKLELDGGARAASRTDTQASAGVSLANKKVAQPATAGHVAKSDRGKLAKESGGEIAGPSGKQKSYGIAEDRSPVKLQRASGELVKDSSKDVTKAPQHPVGAAETDDGGDWGGGRDGANGGSSKKRKSNGLLEKKQSDKLRKVSEDSGTENRVKEVTQQPPDRSKWFNLGPWEERMKDAIEQRRLVLLQNLDPTYSSSEVENIVWHGFEQNCSAKVIQRTTISNPNSGQAFAIFNTKEIAQKVIRKLQEACLMLPNGMPLVGTLWTVNLHGKQSRYFGHLIIDKLKHQLQRESRESREAVSTSHSSQNNTVEYEMALEWRLLQARSDEWWKLLYKKQAVDIKKLQASLKSK